MIILDCADFETFGNIPACCGSCHEEWNGEYSSPSEIEREHLDAMAMICCTKVSMVRTYSDEDWKELIDKKRKALEE
jgi:hypothetical protein